MTLTNETYANEEVQSGSSIHEVIMNLMKHKEQEDPQGPDQVAVFLDVVDLQILLDIVGQLPVSSLMGDVYKALLEAFISLEEHKQQNN